MEGTGVCQRGGALWFEPSPKPAELPSLGDPATLWLQVVPKHLRLRFPMRMATMFWDTAQPSSPPHLGQVTPASPQPMCASWWTPYRRQHFGCSKDNFSFSRQKLGCSFTPTLGSGAIGAQTWFSRDCCWQPQAPATTNSLIEEIGKGVNQKYQLKAYSVCNIRY